MNTEKNRHILLFTTAYHPLIGGAEIAAKEILDRLPSSWRVTIVTARLRKDLPQKELMGRITVHRIGIGHWSDKIRLALFGERYAEREIFRADIIWGMMASYGGFAALFYKKRHPRTPFLLTLQEGDSMAHIYRRVWFVWPWFRQIFTRADRIQAISTFLADWAKRMGAMCPVEVIPNGVDVERSETCTEEGGMKDQRLRHGIPGEAKVILTISRLTKKNGIEDLIRAGEYLPKDTHLLIVGTGEFNERLKKVAKECAWRERVHFAGGIPHEDLPGYFVAADVFCRPSLSEGLGIVFLESMAAGLPVVATSVGGIPDIIKNEQTGLFALPKDPKDIAEKIMRFLNDDELRDRVVCHARAMVREKYTWDLIATCMNTIFVQMSSSMRILIAADIFPPESGGPATYAVTLANEFTKQGIGVKIVSLNPNSDRSAVQCPVFSVRWKNKFLRYAEYFFLLFKHGKASDLIYAMGPVNAGLPALIAARILQKKCVVKVVGDYAWEQWQNKKGNDFVSVDEFQQSGVGGKIGWLKQIERQVTQRADAVIVPSQYLKNLVIGWKARADRTHVIYNALTLKIPDSLPRPSDERWIVSVGRLVPWKGMQALIEIFPHIQKECRESLRLKIIGDGPEMELLRATVRRLHLEGAVDLLGNLSHDKTLQYIHSADLVVLNSGYEGLSHVLLEALNLGRPVFASRSGGNTELGIPEDQLFAFNNTEDMTVKIVQFLKSERSYDTPPKREFFDQFSFGTMIQKTQQIFEDLCAN